VESPWSQMAVEEGKGMVVEVKSDLYTTLVANHIHYATSDVGGALVGQVEMVPILHIRDQSKFPHVNVFYLHELRSPSSNRTSHISVHLSNELLFVAPRAFLQTQDDNIIIVVLLKEVLERNLDFLPGHVPSNSEYFNIFTSYFR